MLEPPENKTRAGGLKACAVRPAAKGRGKKSSARPRSKEPVGLHEGKRPYADVLSSSSPWALQVPSSSTAKVTKCADLPLTAFAKRVE